MFPILWRYLLRSYFKIFFLCLFSFVALLIVSRFKEIAKCAALSGSGSKAALFILYQIPFIIPLALPISSLCSSFLLVQRMSRTQELSSLRAAGISLPACLSPLLLAATGLSLGNLWMSAAVSPFCWQKSKELFYEETSSDPIFLLQRQGLIKIKDAYLRIKTSDDREAIDSLLLIVYNPAEQGLALLSAKALKKNGEDLLASQASLFFHSKGNSLLETQKAVRTNASDFSSLLKKHSPKLEPNGMTLKMLALHAGNDSAGKESARSKREMIRRISLSLAPLSFTLLGFAFGLQPIRSPAKRTLAKVFFLASSLIVTYLGLRSFRGSFFLALCIGAAPHLFIVYASLAQLKRQSRGRC